MTPRLTPELTHYKNLHELLESAASDDADRILVQGSYRVSPDVKEQAERICSAAGTSLSTFIRKCCENLVEEFNSCDPLE